MGLLKVRENKLYGEPQWSTGVLDLVVGGYFYFTKDTLSFKLFVVWRNTHRHAAQNHDTLRVVAIQRRIT